MKEDNQIVIDAITLILNQLRDIAISDDFNNSDLTCFNLGIIYSDLYNISQRLSDD